MPIAWASPMTLPTQPLFPRGLISQELPTKFSSSTTSWIIWLGASKPILYLPSGPSTQYLYVPKSFMPLRSISTLPATPLPSLETLLTKRVSSLWSRSMSRPFVSFLTSRIRQLWMPIWTMEMTCLQTGYPKLIGKILGILVGTLIPNFFITYFGQVLPHGDISDNEIKAKLVCLGTGYRLWVNTANNAVNKLDNILLEHLNPSRSTLTHLGMLNPSLLLGQTAPLVLRP